MLEEIESEAFDVVVHRLERRAKTTKTLEDIGSSARNRPGIQKIVIDAKVDIEARLTRSFEPKLGQRTRFSNGEFGVLYTALDDETAISELSFHSLPQLRGSHEAFQFEHVTYSASGAMKDVRAHLGSMPYLNNPDKDASYRLCNLVGLEAKNANLDALLSMSARRASGVCAPIFRRSAISVGSSAVHETVTMTFDADSDGIAIARTY